MKPVPPLLRIQPDRHGSGEEEKDGRKCPADELERKRVY